MWSLDANIRCNINDANKLTAMKHKGFSTTNNYLRYMPYLDVLCYFNWYNQINTTSCKLRSEWQRLFVLSRKLSSRSCLEIFWFAWSPIWWIISICNVWNTLISHHSSDQNIDVWNGFNATHFSYYHKSHII